jgi:hypothetical protein
MQTVLKFFADVVALIVRFAVFLGIALVGGIGSAWVMIHDGSRLSTVRQGPWVSWPSAGKIDADPYTRAHTVRVGLLPLNPSLALTYHARADDEAQRLHSSCDYLVDLDGVDAQWWSIAAFDDAGRSIANTAQRYAFNTTTITRDGAGKISVVLARDARPGNWLPTAGAGNVTLAFTVQDPKWTQQSLDDQSKPRVLPTIRKIGCPR